MRNAENYEFVFTETQVAFLHHYKTVLDVQGGKEAYWEGLRELGIDKGVMKLQVF